jgi:hypothetical protein
MMFGTLALFPLVRVSQYMADYFVDKDFNVYSVRMKNRNAPARLAGTVTPTGQHNYTLNKRTFSKSVIKNMAASHADFLRETGQVAPAWPTAVSPGATHGPAAVPTTGLPVGRTRSAKKVVGGKGFMLATVGPSDKLVFGTDAVFHESVETAKEEALRVAGLKPGTEVVVLQVIASVSVGGAAWK